jgi:hypothetical protein
MSELYDLPDYSSDDLGVQPPQVFLKAAEAKRMRSPWSGSAELEDYGRATNFPLARNARAASSVSDTTRAAAASSTAAPELDPNSYEGRQAGYQKRLDAMMQEYKDAREPVNYDELKQQAQVRGPQALNLARAQILAGIGGDTQGAEDLGKASLALLAPQKIEGGTVDAAGNMVMDPGYQRQKKIEALRDDITNLEKIKQSDATAREKMIAQARQDAANLELRREIAAGTRAIAAGNLELRRDLAAGKREGLNKDAALIEDRMGGHFEAQTKDLREELAATGKVRTLPPGKLNSIQQQSVVTLLNKFLDPGSVVREGEFDRIFKSMGGIEKIQMMIPKLTTGTFINERIVKDIRDLAELYERAAQGRMSNIATDYADRASRRGVDPRNVVGMYLPADYGKQRPGEAPGPAPRPGDVDPYYRRPQR